MKDKEARYSVSDVLAAFCRVKRCKVKDILTVHPTGAVHAVLDTGFEIYCYCTTDMHARVEVLKGFVIRISEFIRSNTLWTLAIANDVHVDDYCFQADNPFRQAC